ncbi:uncharacterized protein LOC105439100 [Strongylocentrotus purpuratus]|uniref:Uncharacterized protein n=1 Tax=Strongylocentrotus purpuratus TaxID=7668 RepID=A0A7M7PI24_STRPU|nr:uncharacterized protein LOC105439100 [Strongylocentrotus purpuratus]
MYFNRPQSCPVIDIQDSQGKTPLHLAVEGGFSQIIEALTKARADLNIQANDGKTCLHLVVTLWCGPENPDKKVQTTSGFEQVSSGLPDYEPCTENEKLLLYLLDKGADCTLFDASGNTPIHYTNTHRLWQLVVSSIEEIRSSKPAHVDFGELKTAHYESLIMRVFQVTETRIVCKNPLKKKPATEAAEGLDNLDVERSVQKVTDDQLIEVSKKITHAKYFELSVRLGCSLTSSDNILDKHHQDCERALLEVLNAWNQRTTCNHRDELIKALIKVEAAGLITEIFPDYVHDHEPAVAKDD